MRLWSWPQSQEGRISVQKDKFFDVVELLSIDFLHYLVYCTTDSGACLFQQDASVELDSAHGA